MMPSNALRPTVATAGCVDILLTELNGAGDSVARFLRSMQSLEDVLDENELFFRFYGPFYILLFCDYCLPLQMLS